MGTRDHYQIAGSITTFDELTTRLNFILQRLSDRIDQMEGIRGTPNFNASRLTNIAAAGAETDAVQKSELTLIDILTNKGDLLSHGGTGYQRLAVGANKSALVCDSATTTGLNYAPVIWADGTVPFTGKQTVDALGIDSEANSPFLLTSNEDNGGTAVGFRQKLANSLTTAGSVLWTLDDVTDPILQIKNVTAFNPTLIYQDKGITSAAREFQQWKDNLGVTKIEAGTDSSGIGRMTFPAAQGLYFGSVIYNSLPYAGAGSTYGDIVLGRSTDQITYLNAATGTKTAIGSPVNQQTIFTVFSDKVVFHTDIFNGHGMTLTGNQVAAKPYLFTFSSNTSGLGIGQDNAPFFWGVADDSAIWDSGTKMNIDSDKQVVGGRTLNFVSQVWTAAALSPVTGYVTMDVAGVPRNFATV